MINLNVIKAKIEKNHKEVVCQTDAIKKQKNGFRTLFARSIKILPEFHFYF